MGGNSGAFGSSNLSSAPTPPKILLAKPTLVTSGLVSGKLGRGGGGSGDDDPALIRNRLPNIGSLNLISDSWEFNVDRFLPFLTENTDFTVVGVIGPPGVGKSTIMNELYGLSGSSPEMLPPFAIQSEDTRALARHCTTGLEPRVSSERFILLDTQPIFSPSVLAEMMRPDGSSTVQVLTGESLSAELAHELMGIQLGVLLASICHIVVVVSEGVRDINMWRLMSTVDLLKHGIPDPSVLNISHSVTSSLGGDKESKDKVQDGGEEYMAVPVFVHTKIGDEDHLTTHDLVQLKKAHANYFRSSSYSSVKYGNPGQERHISSTSSEPQRADKDSTPLTLFTIPLKTRHDYPGSYHESYSSALWRLRDEVLSMNSPSFTRPVSEREWLKNSAKIWELVKNSTVIAEYSKTLQSFGLFRR